MRERVKATMKILTGVVGFVAALIAIYQFIPETPDVDIRLVPEADPVVLSAELIASGRPVVADTLVVAQPLASPGSLYVVTNHLSFGGQGSLRGTNIVILATRISRGHIDVSGDVSTSSGAAGSGAGSILIAAARVDGTIIDASGGDGAEGTSGAPGRPGRDGDCAGFGGWVGASDGGNGADGGNGGAGGSGGTITLLLSESDGFPEPAVVGGEGGSPGKGGGGGRGGRGCTGLGGSQRSHPPGRNGIDGRPGQDGAPGALISRRVRFEVVRTVLENVDLTDGSALATAVEQLEVQHGIL